MVAVRTTVLVLDNFGEQFAALNQAQATEQIIADLAEYCKSTPTTTSSRGRGTGKTRDRLQGSRSNKNRQADQDCCNQECSNRNKSTSATDTGHSMDKA